MTTLTRDLPDHAGRRAVLLGTAGAVASGVLSAALATSVLDQWRGWGVQEVADGVGLLATAAAALAGGWAALVLTAATVSVLHWRTTVERATAPGGRPLVRRVAAGLLVLGSVSPSPALATVPAHVATAAAAAPTPRASLPSDGVTWTGAGSPTLPTASPPHEGDGTTGPALPQPGWTPTVSQQAPRPSTDVALVSTPPSEPTDHVVVHRGDTLWGLVARHLGDRATDQDVAEEWPRWYAANRDVIGADPDLILPGQQLVVPPAGWRP